MNKIKYAIFLIKSLKLIPKYFKENKLNQRNIKNFLQGTYRLYTLGTQPIHIREQLWYRLKLMNLECIKNKSCIMCGCEFIGLALVDKACKGNCYPDFMDVSIWEIFKQTSKITETDFTNGKKIVEENIDFIPR